jgi:hypothetical protein
MQKKLRTLVYRPGLESANIPCLLIGEKKLAQKYGWEVGGLVEVLELPRGIFIRRIPTGEVKKGSPSERSGE